MFLGLAIGFGIALAAVLGGSGLPSADPPAAPHRHNDGGGKLSDAKLVHAEFVARSDREYVSPFLLALSAAATEDRAEAIRLFRLAYDSRDAQLTTFGKYWPGAKRLQEDPKIGDLLVNVGLN